ncbi:MAG: hypothetical protein C0481_20185 [Phenylobacterium sp.]|uniref:hypothetical protein n=1 Tax=Phenylobacterium sp. TaxID=1871053 RepID=UPI0025D635EC|nr:hypothetical protein [Phenylobacterium sp.]MBA4014184.1 hypothetical protein [Phenylobacterium sp.]
MTAIAAPDAVIVTVVGAAIFFPVRMPQTAFETFGNAQLVYPRKIDCSVYMVCVRRKIVFASSVSKVFELNGQRRPQGLWLVFLGRVVSLAAMPDQLAEKSARARMKLWADAREARRPSTAGA